MKKILGLTIAVLLIIGIVGGGTYSYFSDTETSTDNTFTAGTLNLVNVIDGTAVDSSIVITEAADGLNDKVEFGLTDPVKPGSSGTIIWTLSNTGDLPGILTMPSPVTTFTDGVAANEPEAAVTLSHVNNGDANGDLDEFVGVKLQRGVTYILGDATTYVPFAGLQAALVADSALDNSIAAGGNLVYTLSWSVATDIVGLGSTSLAPAHVTAVSDPVDDNIIQGDTATLDITFVLTQS